MDNVARVNFGISVSRPLVTRESVEAWGVKYKRVTRRITHADDLGQVWVWVSVVVVVGLVAVVLLLVAYCGA